MKISFIVLTAALAASAAAQTPQLQAGVSVRQAVTTHAAAWPEADQQNAVVLAITSDGRIYVGVQPADAGSLPERIRTALGGKRLFIKVDARVEYSILARVLDAVRKAGIDSPVLLTSQKDSPEPVFPVPPKGIEVFLGSTPSGAIVVHAAPGPVIKVGAAAVHANDLPDTLRKALESRSSKDVVVKALGTLTFGEFAQVIDACRAAGAAVFPAAS